MAETRKRRVYGLSREEFGLMWNASNSSKEAARKMTELCRQKGTLGPNEEMKTAVVLARVTSYRKKGVELKEMPRSGGGNRMDVDALNKVLREAQAQEQPAPQA